MSVAAVGTRTISLWDRYVSGNGLTLTLAAFLVLAVTYPVQRADWVDGMFPPTVIGLLGLAFATMLVHLELSVWRAASWATGVGILVAAIGGTALTSGDNDVHRFVNFLQELNEWVRAVPADETRGGLIEFAVFLIGISWTLGFLAGWMALRRRQGWPTVLLGGAVLSIVLSNAVQNVTIWLAVFMVAGVLLLIHMTTVQRMVGWRARHLAFEPATVLSQSGIILWAGALIILLVSAFPTPGIAPLGFIADAFEDTGRTVERHFSRLFNGLPSRRQFQTITFDDITHFSGNPHLTDALLFRVTGSTSGYWRARTYTTYGGTGWESIDAAFGPFEQAGVEDAVMREATHEFYVTAATDTFFSSGLPVRFDDPVEALTYQDAPNDALQVRFTEGREFFPTRTNLRYKSAGARPVVTESQLRRASTEYPEAVAERYTQLPDTLPQRVRDLTEEIVEGHDSAYDQAEAIRRYVTAFPYNLNISAPPLGADGVDHFLFELQQGYCDYYASSMAVMLRTLGVPARYVLGYASGQWQSSTQSWQVLDLNYHSWVEVYFPEFGWIRFEPTPPNAIEFGGRANPAAVEADPLVSGGSLEGLLEEEEEELGDLGDFSTDSGFLVNLRLIGAGIAVAFTAFISVVLYRWWWRLGRLSRPDEMYAKLQRLATLLGVPPRSEQTPNEYSSMLGREMPEHAADFHEIARLYAWRRYANTLVSMGELRVAEGAWSRLRWALVRRMFRLRSA